MSKAGEELTNVQSEPVGYKIRSKNEVATIMKRINSLPEEQRGAKLDEMISLAGHTGPGMDDCDLCKMVQGND